MSSSDARRFIVQAFDLAGVTITSAEVSEQAIELSEGGRFIVEIVSSTCYVRAPYEGRKGTEYPDPVLVVIFERIDLNDDPADEQSTKH